MLTFKLFSHLSCCGLTRHHQPCRLLARSPQPCASLAPSGPLHRLCEPALLTTPLLLCLPRCQAWCQACPTAPQVSPAMSLTAARNTCCGSHMVSDMPHRRRHGCLCCTSSCWPPRCLSPAARQPHPLPCEAILRSRSCARTRPTSTGRLAEVCSTAASTSGVRSRSGGSSSALRTQLVPGHSRTDSV